MFRVTSYLEQKSEQGDDILWVAEIGGSIWFALADGAGGTGNGSYASAYIAAEFRAFSALNGSTEPEDFERFLIKMDRDIYNDSTGGQSTAVIGMVKSGYVFGASIGDSEAWIFNSEFDHELTQLQKIKPLLGSGAAQPIGFGPIEVGKTLLVGSDGLFKYSNSGQLRRLIGEGAEIERIAELAKSETKKLQDDLAIILVKCIAV